MSRSLIRGGRLVLESGVVDGDILVDGDSIAAIGPDLAAPGAEIVDARECYVVPGGIDAHTHMNLDVGFARATDDFRTGSIAAACGGTTTIIDHMGFGPKGCDLHHQLGVYHEWAAGQSVIDYCFHGVVQHVDDAIIDEMESMVVDEGITSFKVYMTYNFRLLDHDILRVLQRLHGLGAVTTVHAENHEVIEYLRGKFVAEGKLDPIYHAHSRPAQCESEAIGRMLELADLAGDAALYIVHLSSGRGLEVLRAARARDRNVMVETCPQYLLLTEDRYLEPDNGGLKYIMSPPLRVEEDNEALWQGVADGSVDVVATDHCPFNLGVEKQLGVNNFVGCPGGAPGVETRLPLMFSEGVMKDRIGIERFVDLMATNPAKIFGLYPRKGALRVGADADIVLIDPRRKVRLTQDILHQNVDYTPFEGVELQGYPVLTMQRGRVLARDNVFVGESGGGRFLKREPKARS